MTASPKAFDRDEQERYWAAHGATNKADAVAPAILRLARPYLGDRALDVGASTGALMAQYRRLRPGAQVVGIDLVPMSPEVRKGDCTHLELADASLDTVTCTDVIEHLSDEDLDKTLREMRRVLALSGHAVLTTLNDERLEDLTVSCPGCDRRFHAFGHCQVFTPGRLEGLLEQRGFEVVKVATTHLHLVAAHPFLMTLVGLSGVGKLLGIKALGRDLVVVARAR